MPATLFPDISFLPGIGRTFGLIAALFLAASPLSAQFGPDPIARYDSAYFAWDRGDYLAALDHAEHLLDSEPPDAFVDAVALLTGELYPTLEVAPEGHSLRWSPDGVHVSYELGERSNSRIQVVRVDGERPRAHSDFEGWDANFLADGRSIVYFRHPRTEEWEAAREAEQVALEAGDENALRAARIHLSEIETRSNEIVVRSLVDESETVLPAPTLERLDLATAGDGSVILVGRHPEENGRYDLYLLRPGAEPRQLSSGPGMKGRRILSAGEERIVYSIGTTHFAIQDLAGGPAREFEGRAPAISADGSTLVFLSAGERDGGNGANAGADLLGDAAVTRVVVLDLESNGPPEVIYQSGLPLADPAPSPSGRSIAFATVFRDDWEIVAIDRRSGLAHQITHEIQHDRHPFFLGETELVAIKGEARHSRAYLYPLSALPTYEMPGDFARRIRLFHNNTVRTVAPQYAWDPSPGGQQILVTADRDGDTLSPERGIYLVDLRRKVAVGELKARIAEQRRGERELREMAKARFAGIEDAVRSATEQISIDRIAEHAEALYGMGSKFITQPGNGTAIEYLTARLRRMGYVPALEWIEPREGVRTANVVATLSGTTRPEQVNVISSHFDSVDRSPGADDNDSGTTALLEIARVLADRPQAETIRFVFTTGEEAGLLGSREHVRLARERGDRIVGVINNDMFGWGEDQRLDNTIRYSNRVLRDVEHGAAMLFSELITYDARYVLSTDAEPFWEAYGDIITGMGSYPILGNPHYHQSHDGLETVNQRLVTEVARTTVATAMWMANDPGTDVRQRESSR